MCAIKFNICFLKTVKIQIAVFWFFVVIRGFVVFGQWVDLRTVFLCLILGSCGVSGFSLFSWSLFLVNLCTLCLFVGLCGVSHFCDEFCSCHACASYFRRRHVPFLGCFLVLLRPVCVSFFCVCTVPVRPLPLMVV
jgi:hypothetical protein